MYEEEEDKRYSAVYKIPNKKLDCKVCDSYEDAVKFLEENKLEGMLFKVVFDGTEEELMESIKKLKEFEKS